MTAQRHSARIDAALAAVRRVGISHGANIGAMTAREIQRRPGRPRKHDYVAAEAWVMERHSVLGRWPTTKETAQAFGMEVKTAQNLLTLIRARTAR